MLCNDCLHADICENTTQGNCEWYLSEKELKEKWIPVSERLPEERTAVLIWCPERKNTYCACFEEKQWWIFGAYFQKVESEVIAWQPLPEPYKKGGAK